jgi:glycerophosphoryl diester phosphodiesterase
VSPVFGAPGTLVGHRGLGAGVVDGLTQNTMESFLAAVDLGLEWIEVDVRRTRDDELFVIHNTVLPDGSQVFARSGSELDAMGAVRLDALLEAVPESVGVVFDVKSSLADAGRSAATTTAGVLGRWCAARLGDRPALTQSFDPAALGQVRAGDPRMPLGWLTWLHFPIGLAVGAAAHLDVQLLAVHAGSLDPQSQHRLGEDASVEEVAAAVHGAGRELMVWCPGADDLEALRRGGVDALVVDDVPRVLAAQR